MPVPDGSSHPAAGPAFRIGRARCMSPLNPSTLRCAPWRQFIACELRVFSRMCAAPLPSPPADFRIIQFTVQNDHVHLIAEADASRALSSGLRGLAIRIARGVNRALGRRGRVWGDRYHARALTTPRAVRNALVYVVNNFRKHLRHVTGIDPCSSAAWFTGWREPPAAGVGPPPVAAARTWLARVGWLRYGTIELDEGPK